MARLGGAAAAPTPAAPPARRRPGIDLHKLVAATERACRDAMGGRRTIEGLANMVREAVRRFERAWAEIRKPVETSAQPGFACAAGCAWCCNQLVVVAPMEAVAIARHVRGTFAPEALAALKARLAALDARARGLGAFARGMLKTPCAFLVDQKCSIYDARPIRCRSLLSRNVEHCRWVAEHPDLVYAWRDRTLEANPYPQEPGEIADATLHGMATAARDAGLQSGALEMTAALRIALETPDIEPRYLAGEPVFAAAALPASPEAGMPPA